MKTLQTKWWTWIETHKEELI